jgi:hypothetical protein
MLLSKYHFCNFKVFIQEYDFNNFYDLINKLKCIEVLTKLNLWNIQSKKVFFKTRPKDVDALIEYAFIKVREKDRRLSELNKEKNPFYVDDAY